MTQEEKAKRYDEALEIEKKNYITAQDLYEGSQIGVECFKNTLVNIFPELKESEDEKIRKDLIQWIDECPDTIWRGHYKKDILAWLEKQDIFSKKDVDDAYLKGVSDTKNEIEKQYEANYQIRKDIATFLFNYNGDIKDRAKWMNYLGIKVSFVEKQGEKPQGKTALEARTDNELVEEVYSHLDPIKETTDRMTSGNFMHNKAAIKFSANTITKVLELIGIKAQKDSKYDNQNCVKPTDTVEPKFKVGERIRRKNSDEVCLVSEVCDNHYLLDEKDIYLPFINQDNYELVPNKFDITTLKPFDKVLVRDNNKQKWTVDLFSFYDKDLVYTHACVGHYVNQCIPYEDNEHLLGTTNDCDEYYKTWE